jgi:hypothetical protein
VHNRSRKEAALVVKEVRLTILANASPISFLFVSLVADISAE